MCIAYTSWAIATYRLGVDGVPGDKRNAGLNTRSRIDQPCWCRFFLEAVRDQAVASLAKARSILDLCERLRRQISNATRSRHAIRALDCIFSRPVFAGSEFAKGTELPRSTAHRMPHQLRSSGILTEIRAGGSWAAILACPELLSILDDTQTA